MLASITTSSPSISNGCLQRGADAAADLGGARQAGAGQQERELVAAEAGDQPASPTASCRRGPSWASSAVAGVVAERVVELLEAVEVDHRHGELARRRASSARRRSWNRRRLASPVSSSVPASRVESCSQRFSSSAKAPRATTANSTSSAKPAARSPTVSTRSRMSTASASRPATVHEATATARLRGCGFVSTCVESAAARAS